MNKILLIIKREFVSRVQKKSFLIATLLVPILFPAIIFGMGYLMTMEKENQGARVVELINESDSLQVESTDSYKFVKVEAPMEQALEAFKESDDYALLYIPKFELEKPNGFVLYTKNTPGPSAVNGIESILERQIKDLKLVKYNIDTETLAKLNTSVSLQTKISSEDSDEAKSSNTGIASGIGYATGFFIYLFLFIYGGQVMQGVIEEKNSKIVEVIVSTVKPFHFMLGKVVGVASVGLAQILIWVLIMGGIYTAAGTYFTSSSSSSPTEITESVSANSGNAEDIKEEFQNNPKMAKIMDEVSNIPFARIISTFIFYFIGGYLLYGALFAAVGSAVDTPADAQQFMLPIMLPIIIGFIGMSMFVMDDPNGTMSFWLSVIPFTSPIVMMGRIGFGVPIWELALSMVLLIGGFIFTIWLAGRIYRVGILMHGTKVNYKVLAKWFMMKN